MSENQWFYTVILYNFLQFCTISYGFPHSHTFLFFIQIKCLTQTDIIYVTSKIIKHIYEFEKEADIRIPQKRKMLEIRPFFHLTGFVLDMEADLMFFL